MWTRNNPPLAPDWLRVGTDIVGGTTPPMFDAAFSLTGQSGITPAITSVTPPAYQSALDLTITVTGQNFNSSAVLVVDGIPLATTFGNGPTLTATVPAPLLAQLGALTIAVTDSGIGTSNTLVVPISDSPPVIGAFINQSSSSFDVTLDGSLLDLGDKSHFAVVLWGDGKFDVLFLGMSNRAGFHLHHRYRSGSNRKHLQIIVAAWDPSGMQSNLLFFPITLKAHSVAPASTSPAPVGNFGGFAGP
jgi:hypothetical protein